MDGKDFKKSMVELH